MDGTPNSVALPGTLVAPISIVPPPAAAPDRVTPLEEVEKEHILRALEICDGNRTQAAKQLGISIRTLRNKLHEYGVNGRDDAADASDSVKAS